MAHAVAAGTQGREARNVHRNTVELEGVQRRGRNGNVQVVFLVRRQIGRRRENVVREGLVDATHISECGVTQHPSGGDRGPLQELPHQHGRRGNDVEALCISHLMKLPSVESGHQGSIHPHLGSSGVGHNADKVARSARVSRFGRHVLRRPVFHRWQLGEQMVTVPGVDRHVGALPSCEHGHGFVSLYVGAGDFITGVGGVNHRLAFLQGHIKRHLGGLPRRQAAGWCDGGYCAVLYGRQRKLDHAVSVVPIDDAVFLPQSRGIEQIGHVRGVHLAV
ncbi:hypothetical protein D3C71_1071720 [compost metagenome]